MNNSDYGESLIGSENINILNPSVNSMMFPVDSFDQLSMTPTQSLMRATDLPLMHANNFPNLQPSANSINPILGPQIDLNNPLVLGAALQNPGLAAMYFGLQQLSQQVTQYTTFFKPTETLTSDIIFATRTISFYDGRQTRTRTITEPDKTTTRLVSTIVPEVQPIINPQVLVQQAQLQRAFASQLLNGQNGNNFNVNSMNLFGSPPLQLQQLPGYRTTQATPSIPSYQFPTTTHAVTSVTSATVTSTKVYTLVYNALSTKLRTVLSTSVFPTTVTEIITKTLTPSASFNFFG